MFKIKATLVLIFLVSGISVAPAQTPSPLKQFSQSSVGGAWCSTNQPGCSQGLAGTIPPGCNFAPLNSSTENNVDALESALAGPLGQCVDAVNAAMQAYFASLAPVIVLNPNAPNPVSCSKNAQPNFVVAPQWTVNSTVLPNGATEIDAAGNATGFIDASYLCSNGTTDPLGDITFDQVSAIVIAWSCPQGQTETEPGGPCFPIPADFGYYVANPSGLAPQGGSCDSSVSQSGCAQTSEPINPANGNESLTELDDYRSADGKLKFSRIYNSLNAQSSAVGAGWQDNFLSRQLVSAQQSFASTSSSYIDPQTACVDGWAAIAASVPNSSGVTASWDGSTCTLSNGQKLPVFSQTPISASALINPNTSYALSAHRPNGTTYVFACGFSDCGATPGVALQLTTTDQQNIPLSYTLTEEDGSVESYAGNGQLQSITYLGGYSQAMSYTNGRLSAVTDSFGRSIIFSYNASGLLGSISTPDGVTQYSYDAMGRLTAVTRPDGTTRQYQYGNSQYPNALTAVIDENGALYASISYDSLGRAVQGSLANGVWQNSVDYTNSSAPIVTDAFGVSRTYQYTNVNFRQKLASISGQSCNTCNAPATGTYDLLGYYSFVTDWNGNTTAHANEPSGLEVALTEAWGTPLQRTTFRQWDEVLRLPTEIDEPGRSTTFNYDSFGNLLNKTITDVNSGTARTITYGGYTAFGQPLSVTGPRTDVAQVTQYAYFPIVAGDPKSGMLSQITDSLGHVTSFNNYNASGHPTQITDPNGLVTLKAYDARGRLLSSQAGSELTQHSYDGAGQLIETQLPNGAFLKYSYNAAHQLVGVLDQIGNRIEFSPDAMGNNISERTYNAAGALVRTHTRLYNSFNQLIQDVGAQNQITAYQNDNNGNRTSMTSPLGFQASSTYDALNRLSSIADPTNGIKQYTYTALDQIAAVADPRTLVTTYLNDAFGDPTHVTSPDSGLTVKTFDAAGNVMTQTDNKGQLTSFSYDALNRVTQITRADQSTVTFSYDQGTNGIGHVTGMIDASGSTNWSYDQHGRVTQKTSVVGSTTLSTLYGYDTAGRLISMTMPSGKQVSYTWSNGQIVAVALERKPNGAPATLVSNIVYFPFGNPMSWTLGDGEAVSRVIDLDGRITTDDVESIAYDSDSRIVTRTLGGISALSDTQSFGYDASNRLTSYSDSNESVSYQYDLSGNRIQQVTGTHEITYAIDSASNRILSSQRARVSGGNSPSVRENVVVPAIVIVGGPPPVTISINPTSIILSEQATLTWVSPGADSCTASGDWNGPEQTSGSTVEMPITAGTLTYTLTCSNSGGSTTSSAALTVNAPAAGETIFNYDPNGSLKNDGVFNYSYDAANRLNQAEKIPAGTATPTALSSYVANGLNQRVMMMTGTTVPVTTSLLSYDEAGHLVGHYANVAKVADATETVWLGDMPVAIVKPANTFYIHTDYMNTPRQISDANRDPVWAWEPQNFGANAPNTDPTNSGTNFSYILRFPGQFADQEPGLRYNYYRDYDASRGRYTESDPLGLRGGINTYAYVNGNPISGIDPLGLLNLFVTGGGYLAAGSTGGEISSGGYLNFSGVTLTQAGGLINNSPAGSQSALGLGGSLGATIGFVLGTPSDLAGPFQNGHLSIGPITIDVYADGSGNIVGGGIGFGPGLGGGITKTNTTLYPASCK